MSDDALLVNWLVGAVLLGLLPAWIAQRKGHSFGNWWFFGALLFIVALPAALLLKPNLLGQRKCPHCAEYVLVEAKVCKHCHRDLPAPPAAAWYPNPEGKGQRYWDGMAWTTQVRSEATDAAD